jgi:hypothetical protein
MKSKASWIPLVVYNPLFANEFNTINLLIINLTFNDLVMEIMQNSFIHNLYILCIDIMHWKHIWHMNL